MPAGSEDEYPVVYVVSDSLGDTAANVVEAALAQFSHSAFEIGRLSQAKSMDQVREYLDPRAKGRKIVVFHTLADNELRDQMEAYCGEQGIETVDLLGPAINALSKVLGEQPQDEPGAVHEVDEAYFRRIEAMEYTVNHDDGRNEFDLRDADIVIIGVSRTSKTPLSLILASRGYRVANIPLAIGIDPPTSLYKVDSRKVFGLMSTVEVLHDIRLRRLGAAKNVAADYADPFKIQQELDASRVLMRRLGCIVVHTDNKAIEETAQEILRYYKEGSDVEIVP